MAVCSYRIWDGEAQSCVSQGYLSKGFNVNALYSLRAHPSAAVQKLSVKGCQLVWARDAAVSAERKCTEATENKEAPKCSGEKKKKHTACIQKSLFICN